MLKHSPKESDRSSPDYFIHQFWIFLLHRDVPDFWGVGFGFRRPRQVSRGPWRGPREPERKR
eukprot:6150084-Pyramimonas_sp.AAC.1